MDSGQWTTPSGVQPAQTQLEKQQQQLQLQPPSPPFMSANVSGPVDPHEYYQSFSSTSSAAASPARLTNRNHEIANVRSYSQSPERARMRPSSNLLAPMQQKLNSAKSQPVLSARQPGAVKEMAHKYDQDINGNPSPVRTANEKYRRQLPARSGQKSPTSPGRAERTMLPRKPVVPRSSPYHTPSTSFESTVSNMSNGTMLSALSQQDPTSPERAQVHRKPVKQPLFGEITPDGMWNGNFDFPAYLPSQNDYFSAVRRGSDGDLALGSRRHSQTELYHPGYSPSGNTVTHRRSRSDLTALTTSNYPPVPRIDTQKLPPFAPINEVPSSSPPSAQPSKIPVRGRQATTPRSPSSPNTPRSSSAIPTPTTKTKIPRSPGQDSKENAKTTKRYAPPTLSQSTQLLSAKVVAPPPKISPPLRSSRPRQPVSSATTAASRARAAGSHTSPISPSAKRPSEQWLGKPYDPKQERTRRKIPELDQVDFEARRARIQKALSQNLEHTTSLESLKARSRNVSKESDASVIAGAEAENPNIVDKHQADEFDRETADLGLEADSATVADASSSHVESITEPLSLETSNLPQPVQGETLNTAGTEATEFTEFEFDDSPNSTRTLQQHTAQMSVESDLQLLSATTYKPPTKKNLDPVQAPVDTDIPEPQSASGQSSPSDIEDRWGLQRSLGDHGSIKIMLDDPKLAHLVQLRSGEAQQVGHTNAATPTHSGADVPYEESPVDPTLHQQEHANQTQLSEFNNAVVLRAIDTYRDTGLIAPELLLDMESYTLDLNRLSANGGTDAKLIKNLLDSIAAHRLLEQHAIALNSQPIPATPQTPASAIHVAGTAIVYGAKDVEVTPERRSQDAVVGSDDEDDFAAQIRRADEEWERCQRGEGPMFNDEEEKPAPPPKDDGYTPHSSIGPDNSNLETAWKDHRDSALKRLDGRNLSSRNVDSVISEEAVIAVSTVAPPTHAPPPPPPTALPYGMQDTPQMSVSQEQLSGHSPILRKALSGVGTGSARPSLDSQHHSPQPASQSMSSFAESTRVASSETTGDKLAQSVSPGPEHKRLQKRRNVIRELLDTENSYHQDLKIIEDIYKATIDDIDLVTADDRKTLFGNCDEIERFSLQFYDQLRKAVHAIYLPVKSQRWGVRRGSMSTMQSDNTGQTASNTDAVDEDRDRTTTIGKVFLDNLQRMEQLYGAYLRNHDAANQRLSALQLNPTVKCWLHECHNNASDITSAWDLDSLLVKPTQRVSKYPLILQQLLDTTPADHPDYENLKSAVKDTIAMLTRINDAKKRSDLVEQMISGKRKDTDVRSGLAKAFGRRTERLKERVGISEAFQDPDFDALAQSFGGHYIRLQVTMRDFQDYVNQVDKATQNTNAIATALEFFTDVHQSSLPEIESKWRKYGQTIRELSNYSLNTHKTAIQRRCITPLITLIKLHDSPQKLIVKRKKHIIDYAKCKSIEKRGERPDKKTLEASEMYEALNDQLKIELPKLYELTAQLVVACLQCFIDSHLEWQMTWERKLKPLLALGDIPANIHAIVPAFTADYELVRSRFSEFGLCNGSMLADSANFLAGSTSSTGTPGEIDTLRPYNRITSAGSEAPSVKSTGSSKRHSRTYTPEIPPAMETPTLPLDTRVRSNSSMSHHAGLTPVTPIANLTAANRPWSNSVSISAGSAYPSRPATGTQSQSMYDLAPALVRNSSDQMFNRHDSSATFVTAQGEHNDANDQRFSGIFSSALPPADTADPSQPHARALSPTPTTQAGPDTKVLFVCASLFEFNIDRARKEAGYPYHTYETGEIFDVVAQKGELWLAKNQDDKGKNLGWIWEQHFVIITSV